MIRKKIVVIGLLGTILDRGRGPAGALAADRGSVPARRSRSSAGSSCCTAAHRAARGDGGRPISARVSPETRCARTLVELRRPVGLREVYGALHDFARSLPLRPGPRGLSGPHHDRHARRADLPVPADRVALLPGAAAADRAAEAPRRGRSPASYSDHRSRPVEATTASPRGFEQQQREDVVVPQVRHRDAQPRLQRS